MGYANTAANPGAPVRVSFALPTLPSQQQQRPANAKGGAAIPNGSLGSTSTASSSTGSEDQVSISHWDMYALYCICHEKSNMLSFS